MPDALVLGIQSDTDTDIQEETRATTRGVEEGLNLCMYLRISPGMWEETRRVRRDLMNGSYVVLHQEFKNGLSQCTFFLPVSARSCKQ